MKISILGCGNWGSVFGIMQYKNGHEIKLWEFDRTRAEAIKKTRRNDPFLKDIEFPTAIEIDHNLEFVLYDADIAVFAVPTQVLGDVIDAVKKLKPANKYRLSLCKGIDCDTLERPSQLIDRIDDQHSGTIALSGPCIANEIIRGTPTAAVLAGEKDDPLTELQHQLSTDIFRLYKSNDIIGVEISAALKNIIAIGCGISDGLGFGTNTKGALLTRALVEMRRLGMIMEAEDKTFLGLAGIGDLITTAFSPESRNYRYGTMVARGMPENEIRGSLIMTAEGVPTARAVHRLMRERDIDMPICEAVYSILYEKKAPRQAIRDLMGRPLKEE